jgi:Zn-dependent M28 family amino/carboxypeptidase
MIVPLFLLAAAAVAPIIPAGEIRADLRTLSSDAFAGRGPGEVGEAKTLDHLQRAFAQAGLEPAGADGGWLQPVPLVRLDGLPGATLSLSVGGAAIPLTINRQATLTLTNAGQTAVADAPMVFAGFGIVDPARGRDDFAGLDLRGKVVLVLANDPDFEAGRDLGFEGRRLVIAGRVGSKFAAAAKAGAIGVLVIHEDAAASYPFTQVAQTLPAMVPAPAAPNPLKFTGWLDRSAWSDLLRRTGLSLDDMKTQARQPGFRPVALAGVTVSASGSVKATPIVSHNVIARLRGSERPDEAVLYGAHWDANGTNGPDASGDAIRNGAVDNGIGTAELLAVARAFAKGPKPKRTVLFAAWTAEEKGLLGADRYAADPVVPLAKTVAVINLDPHVALPAARTIELIGGGRTTLEEDLAAAATAQGLQVVAEPNPEAGWYFRSDHYPFARRGVPAIAFRIGRDLVAGGTAAGSRIIDAYNARCYHQPCDAFDPSWSAAGAAQEASVAYRLGRSLADGSAWPGWTDPTLASLRRSTDPVRAQR